jgi:hypothetical protein
MEAVMPTHTGRMVLTPVDAMSSPDREALIRALDACGLIGAALPGREDAFAAGDDLLELIVFAGCAVTLDVDPNGDADAPFCHVRIPLPGPLPRPVLGRNTRPPRCPACRGRAMSWRDQSARWLAAPIPDLVCAQCGAAHAPWEWDWKEQGGFGRLLVMVEEVFPGEAVPAPRLMEVLKGVGGSDWRHFYVQD